MHCTRIDKETQAQLTNTVETLHIRVLQNLEEYSVWNTEETEYRVVDDFTGLSHGGYELEQVVCL